MKITEMSPGQLKLHFASLCQYHGADGVMALVTVHRVTILELRFALTAYEEAMEQNDLTAAEDALLKIASS